MVSEMQIKFTSNGKTMQATLESNNAAKHFYQLLPLTLKVEDFANAEKIATLPEKLNLQGLPAGTDANAGDITITHLGVTLRSFISSKVMQMVL